MSDPLPKRIFVRWENEPPNEDEPYLVAEEYLSEMRDDDIVGVYELKGQGHLDVKRRLEADDGTVLAFLE